MTEPSTAHIFRSGVDLSDEEIARWLADEREVYADLGPRELPAESYGRGRFDHWSVLRGGQAPAAGAGQRSMRILLVLGHSFPTQQALWEEVSRRDLDLHVAYTRWGGRPTGLRDKT